MLLVFFNQTFWQAPPIGARFMASPDGFDALSLTILAFPSGPLLNVDPLPLICYLGSIPNKEQDETGTP